MMDYLWIYVSVSLGAIIGYFAAMLCWHGRG